MQDLVAVKAIMASFFTRVSFLEVLRQAAALLQQTGESLQDADGRIRRALAAMLQRCAVECHPDGTLMLHRERYPSALRSEVCRPLDGIDFRRIGEGLYKPLDEFPSELRRFFDKAVENKDLPTRIVDGKAAIPDGIYLPFLDEHARSPFIPLSLFVDHPIAEDIAGGSVVPVVRWGMPMISYNDLIHYSANGSGPEDWEDFEVRASLGAT